jgi:hypothetical protein
MNRIYMITLLALALTGSTAQAWHTEISPNTLRCGNRLVIVGETKVDVLAKCGQPLFSEIVGEDHIRTPYGDQIRTVEEWTYNFGATDFLYVLTFKGGRLVKIQQGERGY